jgi:hypothetical protein
MKILDLLRSRIEQRRQPRRNVIVTAWLRSKDDPVPFVCVLWDISEGGARLTVANVAAIPDQFSLLSARDAPSGTSCRVAWRSGGQIGIQFLDNADPIRRLAKPERVPITQ